MIALFAAVLGLGFLVLVHELGHCIVARYTGMVVEVFSIGFGPALMKWRYKDIDVQLCWIPVGGYVKIAGLENSTEDGFFAKKPLHRLLVAIAGPVGNILFAFCMFTCVWYFGRSVPFHEVTNRIGWVDPTSILYTKGVRPGDKVLAYDGTEFSSSKEHVVVAMTHAGPIAVEIESKGVRNVFEVMPYDTASGLKTIGIAAPASFLRSDRADERLGFLAYDRIAWVNGKEVFSPMDLSSVLNDPCVMITITRGNERHLMRVPCVRLGAIADTEERQNIGDYFAESGLHMPHHTLLCIPYVLSMNGVVEKALGHPQEGFDQLLPKDHIEAVFGQPVHSTIELLQKIQEPCAMLVVERGAPALMSYAAREKTFVEQTHYISQALQHMASTGKYVVLPKVPLRSRASVLFGSDDIQQQEIRKQALLRTVPEAQKALAEQELNNLARQVCIGSFCIHDDVVSYNQQPCAAMKMVAQDVFHTVSALFRGALHPRWMSGPVGIIHIIQQQCSSNYVEALFWLGMISMNLAILNLLPLPILDGGHILVALFELITRIRPSPKILERLSLPCILICIGCFIYITYCDIVRVLELLLRK